MPLLLGKFNAETLCNQPQITRITPGVGNTRHVCEISVIRG